MMLKRVLYPCTLITLLFSSACNSLITTSTSETNLPNPASVHCEEQGGLVEMRQDESGNTYGICIFPDGSECDEWAFFRGECTPGAAAPAASPTPSVAGESTPLPNKEEPRQGWWRYTHQVYGFEISLPEDWVVEEITTSDALMNGHLLELHPSQQADGDLHIRLTFRRLGEDTLLWPTGVGAGELLPDDTLEIAGGPARRVLFVCPTGQINSIYYHGEDGPNLRRGDIEFGLILSFSGVYCQEGYSLEGKLQRVAEEIISSLRVLR
jgi:putative hemolysin